MNRHVTKLLALTLFIPVGCAPSISQLSDISEKFTETRQAIDNIKLKTAKNAFCGVGLDEHIKASAQDERHVDAAQALCGSATRNLLIKRENKPTESSSLFE